MNNLNQYTQVTVDGVSEHANYTSAGNLTGFDGWSYVYDAHNRLVAANGPEDTVALSYDAIGRLTRTVHNGESIDYLYDGDELVAEYHSNGTLLRRFIHGLGNDDLVGGGLETQVGLQLRGGISTGPSFKGTATFSPSIPYEKVKRFFKD